jgi:hypothetical protein
VINGTLDWEKMSIAVDIRLDLAEAGIKMPSGRGQAEEILLSDYVRLVRPLILELPVDSSTVIADLVTAGVLDDAIVDQMALSARRIPPAFSTDFALLSSSRTIDLRVIAPMLLRHKQALDIAPPLLPVPAASFSGILILAYEELPVHGRESLAMPVPCLFPKVWDTGMNLIYAREVTEPRAGGYAMVRYTGADSIFHDSPSGIAPELAALIGENPLRIIARGVFGIHPTDLIIDRDDALLILSSETNRALLRDAKVAVILSEAVLVKDARPATAATAAGALSR